MTVVWLFYVHMADYSHEILRFCYVAYCNNGPGLKRFEVHRLDINH